MPHGFEKRFTRKRNCGETQGHEKQTQTHKIHTISVNTTILFIKSETYKLTLRNAGAKIPYFFNTLSLTKTLLQMKVKK